MPVPALDFAQARQRPADYLNICQTLADTYPFGIAHGIQKDAIQNGMDAAIVTFPHSLGHWQVEVLGGRW